LKILEFQTLFFKLLKKLVLLVCSFFPVVFFTRVYLACFDEHVM